MRRSFLLKFKVALVWIVVVLLTINTATACRWLSAWRTRRATQGCCYECVPIESSCCHAVQKGDAVQKMSGPVQKGEVLDMVPEPEAPMVEPPAEVEAPVESEVQEPAPPEPPVEEPEAQPVDMPAEAAEPEVEEALDNLFGDLPKEAPAEPAAPAAPEEAPAPAEPEAPAAPAEPEETPAPVEPEAPAAPAEPEETPAPAEPEETPAADAMDDLFGPATDEPAPKPAEESAAEPAPADSLDDLFGAPPAEKPAEKPAAGNDPFGTSQSESRELPMRTWVDNTGNYQVRARLIVILDDGIRLLKDSGTTTTVSMRRLSDEDAQYVQQLALQHGQGEIARLAAR